jgi:hypothetical protein
MNTRSTFAYVFHVALRLSSAFGAIAFASFALSAACARSESAGFQPDASSEPDADITSDPDPTVIEEGDGSTHVDPQFPLHPNPPAHGTLSVGTVPANAAALFGSAQANGAAPAPALAYPTPGTMFPPNMPSILFQWKVTAGNLFWIHFTEGTNTFDVYTDGRNPTCDQAATGGRCWESTASDLMVYFGHASDIQKDVTFTISALDTAQPTKMTVSPTYPLHIARTDITGAVYYWSTTAKGIRRGNFGGHAPNDGGVIDRPAPVDYITNSVYPTTTEAPDARCAGCHSLSRDGKKLAVSLNGDVLGIIDVVATIPPPMTFGPPSKGFSGAYIGSSWMTFKPDNKRIVTATTGTMVVRDATNAQPVAGTGVIQLPPNTAGSMPDWAPDALHLAFAATPVSAPNSSYGRHLYGSSIAMLTAQGDGFNDYKVVLAANQSGCKPTMNGGAANPAYTAGARETFANPMFSNDSKWLIASRGECESEGDPTAEVVLAPVQPNAPMNRLVNANRQITGQQVINVTNGMPVWGPTNDPHIAWIAFTSTRDYGLVLTPGSKSGSNMNPPFPGANVRQLWIAAVDLSKVNAANIGEIDPSYPAFRFSAQGLTENNHRPFWTVDAIPQVNNGPPR